MTVTATVASPTTEPPPAGRRRWWARAALAGICALAAVLCAWAIGSEGLGNAYYSAAVRSMSSSGTDLLFGTFDRAGVVTVDKPPLAFWVQLASTSIFGFHGWALLLPQVLEGVAAVFLLHRAVHRWAGAEAAFPAALVLALTPITVAIDRDTNPDTLLTLLLVAAGYAVTRAVGRRTSRRAATWWLVLAAFLLGCGFLTKMLQAWVIVPAVALGYLAGAGAPWLRRLGDLLVTGVVLVVSSLWWVVLVDAWPPPKPYIGSSADGTAWNLVVGYNGLGRILGREGPGGGAGPVGVFTQFLGGAPGPGRLFGEQNAGQISWLLPLCGLVLVVVAAAGARRWRGRTPAAGPDRTLRAGWVLWGGWLLITWLVFSLAGGIFHPYYSTIMAPAIAAVVGAGAPLLRRLHRDGGPGRLLLPAGVAGTAAWAWVIVARDPSWFGWVRWVVTVAAVIAVVLLLAARRGVAARAGPAAAAVAVLAAPALWSGATAFGTSNAFLGANNPTAGPAVLRPVIELFHLQGKVTPAQLERALRQQGVLGGPFLGSDLDPAQRALLDHAIAASGDRPIPLAVEGGAVTAAGYVLATDRAVVGLGGFTGDDAAPSAAQLAGWVTRGRVRFVLSFPPARPGAPGGVVSAARAGTGGGPLTQRVAWVQQHCMPVPGAGQVPGTFYGPQALYDCGAG